MSDNQDHERCRDLTNTEMEKGEEEEQIIPGSLEQIIDRLKKMIRRSRMKAHEEENRGHELLNRVQPLVAFLNTQEETRKPVKKRVRDLADIEKDNHFDTADYGVLLEEELAEMDRKKYLEEMDFEWHTSEHQTLLLAAVKERKKQTVLLKEAELKLHHAEREKEAIVNNAEREKEDILREREERLAMAQMENQDIMRERDKANARYRVLVEQLEGRLQCPICLTVPRETPVITCKEGHLACSSCLQGWMAGGRHECPHCRTELLVGVKSLLADHVIRNIEHECNLNGCGQRVPFDDFADHHKKCQFRLVKCPGSNQQCSMMVPFCQLVPDHVEECSDMSMCQILDETLSFPFPEDSLEKNFKWKTIVIQNILGTFFVRAEKDNRLFTVEVVMKGTEEDCAKVNVEMAVKDAFSGKFAFNCSHHPRPLGKENTNEFCLSVAQAALAKTWAHNKELKMIEFFLNINITVA